MGALPEQIAEFGFGGSLTEKEDSWLSSSGFGTLQNCTQDKTGALEKHPGYSVASSTIRNGNANIAAPFGSLMDVQGTLGAPRFFKRGDQVAVVADGLLYARADELTLQGRVSPWVCEQRTVCRSSAVRLDCCCSGNWSYSAYETSVGVNVAVTYLPTGETIVIFQTDTSGIFPSGTQPRIVPLDNAGTVVLFYLNGAQGKYNFITPDAVSGPLLITLKSGYDVVSDPATSQVWTTYLSSSVLVTSNAYTFGGGVLSIHATTSHAATAATGECSIAVDVPSNRLVYCWMDNVAGTLNLFAISQAIDYSSTIWSARAVWQGAPGAGNVGVAFAPAIGHFFVFTDTPNTRTVGRWVDLTGTVQGGVPSTSGDVIAPWTTLRSRPAWDLAGQRMFFLVDANCDLVLGKGRRGHLVLGIEPRSTLGRLNPLTQRFGVLAAFSYLTAGVPTPNFIPDRISRPFLDSNGIWHVQSFEIGGQGATLQLLCDYALIVDDRVGVFAELGKATYITGAVLSQWDGTRVCEAAFLLDPNNLQFTSVTSPGGNIAIGTYVYAVTYARMTTTGELVRSRPSLTLTGNVAANNTILTLSVDGTGPSNLIDQDATSVVYAELWRSEQNTTSPLYLAERVAVNLFSSGSPVFTDAAASYAGIGVEQLYSDGTNGEIANTPPASPLSLCQWRNRLWITDGEQIYYTKEAAATRAAEWSQAFFAISRGAPERLTAVAPLGEVLMAFSEDRSSYVYGDGPGASGDGSTLVGPVPVISELGCTQPAGIAQLPDGLLVPTRRGLQFLDGKREFSYIGAAIEKTLAAFPLVRCARHIGGTNRVWICLATSDLTSGVAVLLDTFHKTFATVFPFNASFAGHNVTQCSTIDSNGVHAFSTNDGSIYDPNASYLFGSAKYSQLVETPWFKGNGVSAELRARRFIMLMKNLGSSSLVIEIGYDFLDTYHYSITVHAADFAAMEDNPDTLKLRIPFPRQRCQSYRLRFTEINLSAASQGFRFVSLRMSTSLRPGSGKLLSSSNSPAAFIKS